MYRGPNPDEYHRVATSICGAGFSSAHATPAMEEIMKAIEEDSGDLTNCVGWAVLMDDMFHFQVNIAYNFKEQDGSDDQSFRPNP